MAARTSSTVFLPGWRWQTQLCWVCWVAAMLGLACSLALGRTLSEAKVGPFYSRVVVLGASELTEANIRSLYGTWSRELNESRAWIVDVFIDQRDAEREVSGKMRTDPSYDWWLGLYNRFGRDPLPMAEILSYDGNGILRLRDQSGKCTESILSGENFLRVRRGAIDFEILKIYYRPLPPHTESSLGDEATVSVYARASTFPGPEEARDFSLLMQKRFKQRRIMTVIRTDAYFLTDHAFPVVYRFDQKPVPPGRKQYEQSKTMYCFSDRPGIQCR